MVLLLCCYCVASLLLALMLCCFRGVTSVLIQCCLFFFFRFHLKRLKMSLRCSVADRERHNSLLWETSERLVLLTSTAGYTILVWRSEFQNGVGRRSLVYSLCLSEASFVERLGAGRTDAGNDLTLAYFIVDLN